MNITIGTPKQIAYASKIAADPSSKANRNLAYVLARIETASATMPEGAARISAAIDRAKAHAVFWIDINHSDVSEGAGGPSHRVFNTYGRQIVNGEPCDYKPFA